MKWNKKVVIAASALALLLAGGASIKPALAYLTTYTETSGGITLATRPDAEIIEEVTGMTKTIRVENIGSGDVWVRVKLYYPGDWEIVDTALQDTSKGYIVWSEINNDGAETNGTWSYDKETGYFYYSAKIPAESLTDALKVEIFPPTDYTQDFDVIVLYEYKAAGTDTEAGWTTGDSEEAASSAEVSGGASELSIGREA